MNESQAKKVLEDNSTILIANTGIEDSKKRFEKGDKIPKNAFSKKTLIHLLVHKRIITRKEVKSGKR